MIRLFRRTLAFLGLVLLLAGVPLLLWHLTAPEEWFSMDWIAILLVPGDPAVLLTLLGIIGWIVWISLATSAVAEGIELLSSGSIRLRVPGARWAQPAVRALVLAALGSAVIAPMSSADEPRPAEQYAVAPHEVLPESVDAGTESRSERAVHYEVQPGDELWTIAERELGTGERWREIVALNPAIGSDAAVAPGQRLMLPGDTPRSVTVQRGDTLWGLAEEHLGGGEHWSTIHEANRDLVLDPDHLEVGWQLRLPPSRPSSPDLSISTAPGTGPDPGAPTPAPAAVQDAEEPRPSSPQTHAPEERRETRGPEDSTSDGDPSPDRRTDQTFDTADAAEPEDADPGPVGGALAASVVAGVMARRRLQMLDRAVGRRIAPLAPSLQRFLTALVRRADDTTPEADLGATGVVLGWREDHPVMHDLESARCTVVDGSPDDVRGLQAAVVTWLACAAWSTEVEVLLVGDPDGWAAALDDPRIRSLASLGEALPEMQRLCARRRIEMADRSLGSLRMDADVSDAWHPVLFILFDEPSAAELDRIEDCLALGQVGASVLLVGSGASARSGWETVILHSVDDAQLASTGERFQPQLLTAPARRALVDLLGTATSQETEPAPWWRGEMPHNISVLPSTDGAVKDSVMPPWSSEPAHPTLLLLGQTQLIGWHGTEPTRARGQCIEYCAWILDRPGSSATTMTRDLMVAEPTRRSNMSRLRTWLGSTPDGQPYLPDAYSGRIRLHPAVTSDWERFQLLLSGGVNTTSPQLLREALTLVRGQPLEGVAFQWPWASSLLTDMVAMATDAAVVLAERSMDADDATTAQWAIAQGRLVAPDAEALLASEIRLHALDGDHAAVQEKALALSRAARAQGRDLEPTTVRRIQSALHASRVAT